MAKATITLESSNGDSVIVSGPGEAWLDDEIILDVDPQGVYDVGFSVKTQEGAFEFGGRITGLEVPIRKPVLPFWLNPESRKRFQKMWGSPGFFRTVKMTWDGPSGPRSLTLRLSKEIVYTTEDGHDADIEKVYHCVVVPLALNPMFEGTENASQWTNPDDRFNLSLVDATGGGYPLSFGGQTVNADQVEITGTGGTYPLTFAGQTTAQLAYGSTIAAIQTALQGLSTVGAGNVTVTGTPNNWLAVFKVPGVLSSSATALTGFPKSVQITNGLPPTANAATVQAALQGLSSVGPGKVTVTGTPANFLVVFAVGTNGVLTSSAADLTAPLFKTAKVNISYAPNTGYFNLWNPTDQMEWLEWVFDPADSWAWPDYSFGQELKWNRPAGADATRMIVSGKLTKILSVMSDPLMDTYVNQDLSNAAGAFNGVEPRYGIPPYTASVSSPVVVPVICRGPAGAKATLRQRRFWSAESGLE